MSRPADWWVLDLPGDPTPGDPVRVRSLSRSAARMADDAGDAHRAVRGLAGDSAVLTWLGAAGEVFRGALGDFPQMLGKLHDSYEQAADALSWWAGRLDDLQATADRALAQGRQARAEIEALQAQLGAARAAASSASAASVRLAQVPAGGPAPDPAQLRAAVSSAQAASGRVSALSGQLSSAQARLSSARSLTEQARELRANDARTTAHRLRDASDAGIAPKSRWEKFKEAAAAVWKVTVKVATVVAIVVAVVALFVGGPIVWGILLAASAVLLADSLHRYGKGEASAWEVGLNLLGVVPGGRLLTALGKATGLAGAGARVAGAVGRPLAAAGTRLRTAAAVVRTGADDALARVHGVVGDAGHLVLRRGDDAVVRTRPVPDMTDIPFAKGSDEWAREVSARYPTLTPDDAKAVHDYTTNAGYDAMNRHLRTGATDPAVQARVDATTAALAKLPPTPGTTLRGTDLPAHVLPGYQPGAVVSDAAFLSTSTSPAVARSFGSMDLTVHGQTGVDVAQLSHYGGSEAEVLFRPGTPFEVLSRSTDPVTGRLQIVLKEVAP